MFGGARDEGLYGAGEPELPRLGGNGWPGRGGAWRPRLRLDGRYDQYYGRGRDQVRSAKKHVVQSSTSCKRA
jgi:hypothetical protein